MNDDLSEEDDLSDMLGNVPKTLAAMYGEE